jgi:hypothetical protein
MWALSNGGACGPGADPQRARGILLLTADDQSTADRAELSRRAVLARLGVAGTAATLGLAAGAPGASSIPPVPLPECWGCGAGRAGTVVDAHPGERGVAAARDRLADSFRRARRGDMADARVEEYGSGYVIRPLSVPGRDWLRDFAPEGSTWIDDALLVAPGDLSGLVEEMRDAGLDVED